MRGSGSGIPPGDAAIQLERTARERGVPVADGDALVDAATAGQDPGVIGAPDVDVLELDLSLDREFG